MKSSNALLAALAASLLAFLPHDTAFGDDGCTAAPCQNGGICSTVETWGYSCSCVANFLGPTCAYTGAGDEQITAQNFSYENHGTSLGWWDHSYEKSGFGQSFTTTKAGLLETVSFDIYAGAEAVNKPENLIVQFWNVDGSGIPSGSPLASHSVDGSGFDPNPDLHEIVSVNFSADQIQLKPSTQYAFTVSVEHKATVEGTTLYSVPAHYDPPDDYPGGEVIRSFDGLIWQDYGAHDWRIFQVTVLAAQFEDSFEGSPP